MQEYKLTHQKGVLRIENLEMIQGMPLKNVDVGLQVAKDGRIWVCVNGVAFVRFFPESLSGKRVGIRFGGN